MLASGLQMVVRYPNQWAEHGDSMRMLGWVVETKALGTKFGLEERL